MEIKKLAPREEQIMQALWELKTAFVKDIVEWLPEPKPHYNSVSTMVRILQDRGYIGHEAFGRTHRYYPILQKDDYQAQVVDEVADKYFGNSFSKMVAYFAQQEKISKKELADILRKIDQ
ncbi:MAG: BlaI/MecI/CopY family transcriptional regulator [Bacteroidota bacterium]